MPVSYRIDPPWVLITCAGDYPLEEFCRTVDAAVRDPQWPERPRVLFDLSERNVNRRRSREDELAIADCLGRHAKAFGHRYAAVAPRDLQFGLIRIAAVDMERFGIAVHVARTEPEARRWLEDGDPEG